MIRANVEVNVSLILREMSADDLARVALEALWNCQNALCPFDKLNDPAALAKADKVRRAHAAVGEVLAEVFKP